MSHVPPFLLALDLGADADERAIRRAYAKRLKRIDPEADPAAFQALRETFEAALKWVALPAELRRAGVGGARVASPTLAPATSRRNARSLPVDPPAAASAPSGLAWQMDDAKAAAPRAPDARPAAAPLPSPPPSPQPSPQPAVARPAPAARPAIAIAQPDPADRVFTEFLGRFTRLASDEASVQQMLREALADERLVNLESRTRFERRVATLIVGGWRPGHEFLFKPACVVFEWEADRRRLEIFGEAGQVLDAAVRERLIFFAQPPIAFETQKTLLRRLRSERPLSARELAPEMPLLGQLLQRYPNWVRVMTRKDVVQHWIDTWNALAAGARAAQSTSRAPVPARAGAGASPAARAAPRAGRALERVDARPAAASPQMPPHVAAPRSSGGTGRMNWLWVAVIIGGVRFFATLGDTRHPTPPPATAFDPPAVTAPAAVPEPTQTAEAIRQLAGRPAVPSHQFQPSFGGTSPADGTGATAAEQARGQRRLDATAQRQLEIDERYQDILQARKAKRAIRTMPPGDEPVLLIPDNGQ